MENMPKQAPNIPTTIVMSNTYLIHSPRCGKRVKGKGPGGIALESHESLLGPEAR